MGKQYHSWIPRTMSPPYCLILLSFLAISGMPPASSYPKYQTTNLKRATNYDDIMAGFGSDGYLYDFVKKRNLGSGAGEDRTEERMMNAFNQPVMQRFRKSKYPIWNGFGSDGYLYDFTN